MLKAVEWVCETHPEHLQQLRWTLSGLCPSIQFYSPEKPSLSRTAVNSLSYVPCSGSPSRPKDIPQSRCRPAASAARARIWLSPLKPRLKMPEIASSPTPVGSFIFSSVALLLVSLAVLLILRHYLPLRTTPAFYIVPIFFALWLPSVLVLLVPIDLASSAITDDVASRGIWLPQRVVLVLWRITYWLTFCLTW